MRGTYRIVVGVDGSAGGRRALQWAVAEAAARAGTVQAIMCGNWDGADLSPRPSTRSEDERRLAEKTLQRELDSVARPAGVVVAGEVVEGPAPSALAAAARDADLLVLGSHGHGRRHHRNLGSFAEACVGLAVCPVVVIPVPRPVAQTSNEPAVPV
jgi:nucleotide-binding universal stress UspA family protein